MNGNVVLWLCALKDEYDQVLELSDGIRQPGWQVRTNADGWTLAEGVFETGTGKPLHVTATWVAYMGREQAQAIAARLLNERPAACIAMSGICAGRRGKVSLGDVIFAERLWSYDSGKLVVEEGHSKFQGDMLQYRPSLSWVQQMQRQSVMPMAQWLALRPSLPLEYQEEWVLLRLLEGEDPTADPQFTSECPNWSEVLPRLWSRGWVAKPLYLTDQGRAYISELSLRHLGKPSPIADFAIHVSPVATGAAVTEDQGIFPRLADSMRKVLGVDMESSALAALGEVNDVPVIVAKGVSDYGDTFKDDRYRQFAARASAEHLMSLLREGAFLLPGGLQTPARGNAVLWANEVPIDLIRTLAEQYPDAQSVRAIWVRAGGRASEVENIARPEDLWQRLWSLSMQGAAVRPQALLAAAREDLPLNAVLAQYAATLES